jgi:hypothetical protein
VVTPGGFSFNQYLILDDEPLLFHTGPRKMFPLVREAVASIMPVEQLRYVGFSHVEADECGSLNEWLAVAPQSSPLCGTVAALVSINDMADRLPHALADGELLSLGKHSVRWFDTPHLATRVGMRFPDGRKNPDTAMRRFVYTTWQRSSSYHRVGHSWTQRGVPPADGLFFTYEKRACDA